MAKVEIGVTHQIKIGREDAWIKLSITDDTEDRSVDDTINDVSAKVNNRIFDVIHDTVTSVQDFEDKHRKEK